MDPEGISWASLSAPGCRHKSVSDQELFEADQAFAEADRIVDLKIHYPRNSLTPIEGFVALVGTSQMKIVTTFF